MTATRHHTRALHRPALRAALALLVALAGLTCGQVSATTEPAPHRTTHAAAPSAPAHVQSRTAEDDASRDTAASGKSCSGTKHTDHAEAPASARHETPPRAPVTGPGTYSSPGHDGGRVVPGRGAPAPPPSPPPREALSVLRV